MSKKAQGWSIDVMIAVGLFLLVLVGFFYLTGTSLSMGKVKQLREEADLVTEKITSGSGNASFVNKNVVNKEKLRDFADRDYYEKKDDLGISNEFCIYFEDAEGNFINITDITEDDNFGIGNPKAMIRVDEGYILCGVLEKDLFEMG